MSMFAAVEKSHRVVWGVGATADAALSEAKREIAGKPQFRVGALEICRLSSSADLSDDGRALWAHVVQSETPLQGSLFL